MRSPCGRRRSRDGRAGRFVDDTEDYLALVLRAWSFVSLSAKPISSASGLPARRSFYLPRALAGACRGQDSRSSSQGAPSTVSGAPTGSDRQADARPSRSVGMDLVCVTLRWRGVDSNHQYRVTPPRFREGVISTPLDSHQPKGSTNENRHHGNAEGSCDLRPVSDLHDGIGIQPTLRSGRDATSLVHEPTVGTAATGDNGCGSCCG